MPPRRVVAVSEPATSPLAWPKINDPFAQKVIDAATFADLVRTSFADEPERYRQFFDMMLWHERHPLNVKGLGHRAMQVFAGHPDLISGLRVVCPKLPGPKKGTSEQRRGGHLDALMKERFREQPEKYQRLRDIADKHNSKGAQGKGTAKKGKRGWKRKGGSGRPLKVHEEEKSKVEKDGQVEAPR
ncbi:uncharacterized protein SCHCODRAFT_02538544 [Schizophyllum commune H4-8]|nr:uncharacterized protein SCHCODRAFT_02538544 [Schizophyllum commune H4-8]KAI5893460.1 hypothetical protein SCHCODRAFT_02538544 [Schizophyllum commune H4-8]